MSNKIGIIIQREFNARVRKKSFLLTTLLTPLLFVGLFVAIFGMMDSVDTERGKTILVVDRSGEIVPVLEQDTLTEFIAFDEARMGRESDEQISEELRADKDKEDNPYYGVLFIGENIIDGGVVRLQTYTSSTMIIEQGILFKINDVVRAKRMEAAQIDPVLIASLERGLPTIQASKIEDGKDSNSGLNMGLAYVFAILIYMVVLMYGQMVMQGVIEEKSNKVLELMVSSVRPFEMMMGKVIGIALVAILQFILWIALIVAFGYIGMTIWGADMASAMLGSGAMDMAATGGMNVEAMSALRYILDTGFILRMLGCFVFYFVGGYLLYASIFAAIGSAVDNEKDAQNFTMIATLPIIAGFIMMMGVMQDPNSSMAVWGSMIPFTSPIIMMARLPYGVPTGELIASMAILVVSFVIMVWLAAKIYRVGIFMYGKKPTFKDIAKWVRYK